MDYIVHISGQPKQAFFSFQQRKLADLIFALKRSGVPHFIERAFVAGREFYVL